MASLHHQLTSPIDVLTSAIGDSALEMKVQLNGQDEVRAEIDRRTTIGSDNTGLRRQESVDDPSTQIAREPEERAEPDELSVEESHAFIGMDQRRAAADYREDVPEIRVEYPRPTIPRTSWGHQDYAPVQMDYGGA